MKTTNNSIKKNTALSPPKIPTSKSVMSVRAIAAKIILEVLDQGKSLSALLPEYQLSIKSQDIPLLQEICFGVCRVLPRLEQIIKLLVNKPLKGKTRIVHCLLLVGLYQILYTRIPAHAAVDEVINASKSLKSENFKGLLNAVLRNFLREQDKILEKVDKHWQTLHPEWFVNKLKKVYTNWRDIIDANNQKPPMWLRVNLQKTTLENYRTLLQEQGIESVQTDHPQALRLAQPCPVHLLPHFFDGWISVQDLHAQWSALLLAPKDEEFILDACAAPGGKTTHILEKAPTATVVALDVEASRLQRVEENLQRMQQQAVVICGDATKPDEWLSEISESAVQFDRILLDAPCSATGVIRRHPDIKWLRKETDITALTQLQSEILTSLWEKLKVNGTLLYATCSLLPEENSEQVAKFLEQHPNAKLEKLPFSDTDKIGHQFFPSELSGDGFYYAKLRKFA